MAFPFHKQEKIYTCGAACMRMALERNGIILSEGELAKSLGTDKVRGTRHKSFPVLAKKHKLKGVVMRNASIDDLKGHLGRGFTVIACYFCPRDKEGHYSIVRRIDSGRIHFWDPWYGPKHSYSLAYFIRVWKGDMKYDKEKAWFFAVKK